MVWFVLVVLAFAVPALVLRATEYIVVVWKRRKK